MFKHPINNQSSIQDSLQRIQLNLKRQQKITERVKSFLPSELAEHCIHVTLTSHKITLYTHSSVWASKLLYLRKQILSQASKEFNEPLQGFKVKVLSTKRDVSPHSTLLKPTLRTLENMSLASASLDDSDLKRSLQHLINTLKK